MKPLYEIKTYKQYERDVKRAIRRGLDIEKLLDVVRLLRQGKPLPAKFRNHLLTGDYKGFWEEPFSLYMWSTEQMRIAFMYYGTSINYEVELAC